MAQLEKQIEALKKDKADLAAERDSALKEVEGNADWQSELLSLYNAANCHHKYVL